MTPAGPELYARIGPRYPAALEGIWNFLAKAAAWNRDRTKISTDREFNDKWQRRIDGCGPYCSCLVIIAVLVIAFFAFVIR